jgi:hypothetical protein
MNVPSFSLTLLSEVVKREDMRNPVKFIKLASDLEFPFLANVHGTLRGVSRM